MMRAMLKGGRISVRETSALSQAAGTRAGLARSVAASTSARAGRFVPNWSGSSERA